MRRGFTLLEMIVSLGVIGVATLIIISLFRGSIDIESRNAHRLVAAALAEERLAEIRLHPDQYTWPASDALANAEIGAIVPSGSESAPEGYPLMEPPTLPPVPRMEESIKVAYSRFRWKAFVRRPEPETPYLELTVQILWLDEGRPQSFALTSLYSGGPAKGGA
ncbi:MAG: hypothetical protein AMXMBFR84_00040 [Candidatus Hydrogenedentota bacterium]